MFKKMLLIAFSLSILLNFPWDAKAQDSKRPLDLMVVIDNSGSMFPNGLGYDQCCSDPQFLRITGAELFLARLGFSESNEADYQMGIISMGDADNMLISPLQPIKDLRDTLVLKIQKPEPENETRLIDALELAYQELRTSSSRKPGNIPAVVLLTDGVPSPALGQGQSDIEKLLLENKDIPVFIMLLEGEKNTNDPTYQNYIDFWQKAQTRYQSLFVYEIKGSTQIEKTYNEIVAQLQNTIPTPPTTLQPGIPYSVYVNAYVKKIIVTVIRSDEQLNGKLEIKDSKGKPVIYQGPDIELGVNSFLGKDNHVDVISIIAPRLSKDIKGNYWTITSDQQVQIFLDSENAYQINFKDPSVSFTDLNGVYIATQPVNPKNEFSVRFQLKLDDGEIVKEPQSIQGEIIYPNGQKDDLRIPSETKPDSNGFYRIALKFSNLYPDILNTPGRFILLFKAGSTNDQNNLQERIPIAVAKLLVDVATLPYLDSPHTVDCVFGKATPFTVNIGDFQLISPQNASVRVFEPGGAEISLQAATSGSFNGDLMPLCQAIMKNISCSQSTSSEFKIRLFAQMKDGSPLPAIEQNVSVTAASVPCTPLPTNTPLPTPIPTPTPIPDTDHDNWNDQTDKCPTISKWDDINNFEGCPPPLWLLILLGVLIIAVLAFLVFYLWPWAKVRWISPPPKAFVMACLSGEVVMSVKSIYEIGMMHRVNKVKIGGGKKSNAHLIIKGPKPLDTFEYVVEQRDKKVVLVDSKTGAIKAIFNETAMIVSLPNTQIVLRVGLDRSRLSC